MRAPHWILLAFPIALFPLACSTEGDEAGEDTDIIVEDREPDIIIEDRDPDVIVDERDDGFDAEVNVDEDGNVSGGIRVEDE